MADRSKVCYYENILQTIGNTPLVRLNRVVGDARGLILAKLESRNPGGSSKDRIGVTIIEQAEHEGRLKPGGTIVESTSGNTGMGLALVAAVKQYKTVFTLPDKMSNEKIRLLRAFGAEVIVTPTAVPHGSPESYTEVAKRVVSQTPNAVLADQYNNPQNPGAHYASTGPEIWDQTGGQITHLVCGVGTGGTISGAGRYLKERNPAVRVIGVDPKGSALREYFQTRTLNPMLKTYKVEGIGQDYVPEVLDFTAIDDMIEVTDRESFLMARRLTREEGILAGGSAGSAVAGLLRIVDRFTEDDVVVVVLPDSGERYISKIFDDEWMREYGFLIPERITPRYVLEGRKGKTPRLLAVPPDTPVRRALDLLKLHDLSQLPVLENGRSIGSLEDRELMGNVLERPELLDAAVYTVMSPPFPHVGLDDPIEDVIHLMTIKRNTAVLVENDREVTGILTRHDVIEFMAK